jgi:hypothetical protein
MHAVDRDSAAFEFFGQVEGERGQGELAAVIGLGSRVASVHPQVSEVDGGLPDRTDVDYPGGRPVL